MQAIHSLARMGVWLIPVALASGPNVALAQTKEPAVQIKNFGRVNDRIYRGAQPKDEHYQDLARLGVRTVIDLQRKGEDDEQELVESAGMKFVRIPISDTSEPPRDSIQEFLRIAADPANQPVFVHCRGGRHRTGAMVAIYRMLYEGWTAERAYEEMKQYDFKKGFGHGALKDVVFDYYETMDRAEAIGVSDSGR